MRTERQRQGIVAENATGSIVFAKATHAQHAKRYRQRVEGFATRNAGAVIGTGEKASATKSAEPVIGSASWTFLIASAENAQSAETRMCECSTLTTLTPTKRTSQRIAGTPWGSGCACGIRKCKTCKFCARTATASKPTKRTGERRTSFPDLFIEPPKPKPVQLDLLEATP